MMRAVVIGAGMAGLTAARLIGAAGHEVPVLDKGRRPGEGMASRQLDGGALADRGAQFFTVRTDEFAALVDGWLADGTVHEWCRGFSSDDGHPRFAAAHGMAELAARMIVGLRRPCLGARRRGPKRRTPLDRELAGNVTSPGGVIEADVVVLTPPIPQSVALVGGVATLPVLDYEPMISLLVALDNPPAIPHPGGIQFDDDPTWSWIGDNVAKGISVVPAVTRHTRADVAIARWDEDHDALQTDLLLAAAPWLGAVNIIGGPRIEGAFLSGRAAADAVMRAGAES